MGYYIYESLNISFKSDSLKKHIKNYLMLLGGIYGKGVERVHRKGMLW